MLTHESESNSILSPLDDRQPQHQQPIDRTRITALDLGNSQIPGDLLLQQLAEWKLLSRLIEEIRLDRVLAQAALDANIDLDDRSVEFDRQYALNERSKLYRGMNSQQLTVITERELKLQKFKQVRWGDRVAEYFTDRQQQLDRVVISTLKVADPFLARELFFRIQAREASFAEIALEYSQDAYRQQGGTIGPVFFRDLSPAIGRIVRKLQPGELSVPVAMGEYHCLIRLERLEPAQLNEPMQKFLLDELFNNWFQSEISEYGNLHSDISPDCLVDGLSRSPLLVPYLRETIIRETLAKWQASSEYRLLLTIDRTIASESQPQDRIGDPVSTAVLLQQYQQAKWGHLLNPRFLQSKSRLDRVLFSAIQVKDYHLALEISARIQDDAQSLPELAIEYSQHPTAKMGGAIGPIPLAQLHPLIYHQLIGLKPQQLSPIFQLDGSYVLLRLECWLPVKFDRQIEQQFLTEFLEQWLDRQIADQIGLVNATSLHS